MRRRSRLVGHLLVFCAAFFFILPADRSAGQGPAGPASTLTQDPAATPQNPATGAEQVPAPAPPPPPAVPQHVLTIGKIGNGQGRVTNSPGGAQFKRGTLVTLGAVPEANSLFAGWSGNCSGFSMTCSIVMTADKTVTASFSLRTYTIRVASPMNGVIHPSGMVKATYGDKRKFEVIPLPGYRVAEVLVDKASVGAVNSYTFKDIRADHVLEAVFAKQ